MDPEFFLLFKNKTKNQTVASVEGKYPRRKCNHVLWGQNVDFFCVQLLWCVVINTSEYWVLEFPELTDTDIYQIE